MLKRNGFRIFFIIFLVLFFVHIIFRLYVSSQERSYSDTEKLTEIITYIENLYVDSVDREELIEATINEMLLSLDPHSSYANTEDNQALIEAMTGAFEGVGVQFNIMNDTVMIVATIAGGPSEKIGLKAGDRIVKVDTTTIAGVGISNEEVFKMLRGRKASTVNVSIVRPRVNTVLNYTIIRDIVPLSSINCHYMITPEIGFIKIDQFTTSTPSEFQNALSTLYYEGMQKLILDLRGNGGGSLLSAIDISDEFLPAGELIVYTEGANASTEKYHSTDLGIFEEGDVVVLQDETSASASEIVAGAIQDNDRGYIVGRRSFGKGLVQQHISLSDNSSIRLTIARYHTPSGRCIQRDYTNSIEEYYTQAFCDTLTIDTATAEKFTTKKGRTVYGGGGIYPDFLINQAEHNYSEAFFTILYTHYLNDFCFDYAHKNEDILLKQYNNAELFVQEMNISESLLQEYLTAYSEEENTKIPTLTQEENNELKTWMKAIIGRNLYQDNGFYPVINQNDPSVLKALELLK